MWNAHSIRKQKSRPNAVTGKPYMLYHHPGPNVQDWGLSFNEDRLRTMKQDVQDWDIDAYLPHETLQWCQNVLHSIGFNYSTAVLPTDQDRTAPFLNIYLQFRARVQEHIQRGNSPQLSLLEPPIGAQNWQVR